jgi:acyl carrier protein
VTQAKYTRAEMRDWLIAYLAELLGLARHEIDTKKSFEVYGLESSGAVGFSGDLEDVLQTTFDTTLAYDFPTIEALLDHLESRRLLRTA